MDLTHKRTALLGKIQNLVNQDIDFFEEGYHGCANDPSGNWRIYDDHDSMLYIKDLSHLLVESNLKTIKHDKISSKAQYRKSMPYSRDDFRYQQCDISVPGIIATNSKNPDNLKYRMLDGSHRLLKMLDNNISESLFYVIDFKDYEKYLRRRCNLACCLKLK